MMEEGAGFVTFVCLMLSVQSRLTVRWNGTDITRIPTLIYHDELIRNADNIISDDVVDGPGSLICSSPVVADTAWLRIDGVVIASASNDFGFGQVNQAGPPSLSQLSSNGIRRTSSLQNGLFQCAATAMPSVYVGLYNRAFPGMGAVSFNDISLQASSFLSNNPIFTLAGVTRGGPPTNYTWTRNGQVITDGGPYSISIAVTSEAQSNREVAGYTSSLVVTGRFPGLYEYTVFNRAMITPLSDDIIIEEADGPTKITAMQVGLDTVLVSWLASSPPPSGGYHILTDGASVVLVSSPPYSITGLQLGMHSIQVTSLSQHFPSDGGLVEVIVRGPLPPLFLTATSVTVSWTQSPFSFIPTDYTVILARVTGSGQVLCFTYEDSRVEVLTGSVTNLTNFEEFSSYHVVVTARFIEFGLPLNESTSMVIITRSAAPTGFPHIVTASTTSRHVSVSWNTIDCIERNGVITGYTVDFQEQGGARIPGEVVNQTFTASGLTPHTNYTFRVAGVNSNGTGPFNELIVVSTAEETCPNSSVITLPQSPSPLNGNMASTLVAVSVVMTFVLTVLLYTTLLLVGCCILRALRYHPTKKKEQTSMTMKDNASYDPVTATETHYSETEHTYEYIATKL